MSPDERSKNDWRQVILLIELDFRFKQDIYTLYINKLFFNQITKHYIIEISFTNYS